MIVVAIVVILAALVANPFIGFRNQQALSGAAEEILSVLQQVRVKTLTAEGGSQYGVHFSSNQVTIFAGAIYNPGNPANQSSDLSSAVTISNINLTGGGSDVIFQKLTGVTSQSGTIVVALSSDASETKTVTINGNGISDVN